MSATSQPPSSSTRLIVLDASTMINLLLANGWQALMRMGGYQLASPKIVTEQITKNRRRPVIRKSIASRALQLVDEPIPLHLLPLFPDWVRRFGAQDAAVLVNALALSAIIGADDQGLCNEAKRQGMKTTVGTEWLLAEIVRQGLISLAQGNRKLQLLRQQRYEPQVPCLCSMCGVHCTCR